MYDSTSSYDDQWMLKDLNCSKLAYMPANLSNTIAVRKREKRWGKKIKMLSKRENKKGKG